MNSFLSSDTPSSQSSPVPKHLETLTTSMFQSLFPPISPQDTSLSSLRRVLLLNRESITPPPGKDAQVKGNYIINLRHYAITTRRTGVSKRVRRLRANDKLMRSRDKKHRGVPDLGKLEDMADYLLDNSAAGGEGGGGGYISASESEAGMTDAEVEVFETEVERRLPGISALKKAAAPSSNGDVDIDIDVNGGGIGSGSGGAVQKGRVEKRAVKLEEIGPRMRLRLIKVEEGLCGGRVMWHDFITKSKEEERRMDEVWEERRKLKEMRRKEQQENVERKRKERGGGGDRQPGNEEGEDVDEWDDDEIDQLLDEDGGQGEEEWEGVQSADEGNDAMEVDQDR